MFFATSGHSGVDRAVKNLVPSLSRRGYNVDLLQIGRHGPYFEALPPGVRRLELPVVHVHSALPHLVKYLKRKRPPIMLSDKDRVNRTVLVARALSGVPTRVFASVGTTVSLNLKDRGVIERTLQRLSMRYLYPKAERIIVTSQGVAEDMTRVSGLPRAHIAAVPSPVLPENFHDLVHEPVNHPWFSPGQVPVILGVGELGARKDFATLVRAFAFVRRQLRCRLVILGRGRQEGELIELARSLEIADDFDLAGFKENPYAFMARAGVFALSSRLEGLGFVLIEALAAGVPVVSTDCPSGPREILHNGRYGELVPVGNAQALAQALMNTLRNPPPRETLREASLPYHTEAAVSAYLDIMGLT